MDTLSPLFRHNHQEHHSWAASFFVPLYTLLIVGVSLYPFSGWQAAHDRFGAFLFYPWPQYFTPFDLAINIAAYLPLGAGLAAMLTRHFGRVLALLLAMALAAMLSLSMEVIQAWLPNRVPSNLDLACNALGGLLGALGAVALRRTHFWRKLGLWRRHLFYCDALSDFGLVLIALWFFTQCDPAMPLFGVVVRPNNDLPQPFDSPIRDSELFLQTLEAAGAFLHLTAVCWLLATLTRRLVWGWRAVGLFLGSALLTKLLFAGLLLKSQAFFAWFNGPVLLGWGSGALLLTLLRQLRRIWKTVLAGLALIGGLIIEKLWPLSSNPGSDLDEFKWTFGQLVNFKGLVALTADIWPWLALGYCLVLVGLLLRRPTNQF